MRKKWIKKAPFIALIAIAALTAFSGIIMLLWNAILPTALHAGTITFWQAMGILVLSKILFGGFRGRRLGGSIMWRRRMHMKWNSMTDEEQREFKQKMHGCSGRSWYTERPQTT